MRKALLLLPLAVTACAGGPPPPALASPHFAASAFFSGQTDGEGTLKKLFTGPERVHVVGVGRIADDGSLMLDQTVTGDNRSPTRREWRIREINSNRYAGTLSDATGPVTGEVVGNRLLLRFRMKGGLEAEQRLDLAADGRSARNHMSVRKLGMVVASLDEIIRKTR